MTQRRLPKLRAVEVVVVPDPRHGRLLVLRDTQGVADGAHVLTPELVPVAARLDGTRSEAALAAETGVPLVQVRALVTRLDEQGFLESPAFERRYAEAQRSFDESPLRRAALAGGAYPGEPSELRQYIEQRCLAAAPADPPGEGYVRALAAPHIDPWRGARGYGRSYGALAARLAPEVDTFLVLGTSHAPMREPFALCAKGYDTPLGPLPCDEALVAQLQRAARFDAFYDRMNHQREHSIEFQAVFLRHLLGPREARIVPVLAGLGAFQADGSSPARDDDVRRFLDAMAELVAARGRSLVVVAGVDLAHVGPRFGDPQPLDEGQRAALAETDRQSLELFSAGEREQFWQHVAADLDERRVCGLAPMYSLLWAIGNAGGGSRVHYEQTVDEEDGSIVSHAGVIFSC